MGVQGRGLPRPAYVDCMVSLSNGGGDAIEVREFDLDKAAFIPGGFALPNAKTDVAWAGPDALFVATDYGPGTLTDSGYARIVKRWQRGTPLGQPPSCRRASRAMSRSTPRPWSTARGPGRSSPARVDFYHHKVSHIASDGRLIPSPLPDDADIQDVLDGRVIAALKSPWQGRPAGALVAYSIPDVLAGKPLAIETVFIPNAHQAVEDVSASQSRLWVKILDDVSGRLIALTRAPAASGAAPPLPFPTSPPSTSTRPRPTRTSPSPQSRAC